MRNKIARLVCLLVPLSAACAADDGNPYDDPPPLAATHGIADCPVPRVRLLSPDEARREAHQRVERGTSCWLAGTCLPGGDYRGDGDVNARVAAAIVADGRFADASVWVETLRKFVTLKGCVATVAQGRALEDFVRSIDGVKRVWLETTIVDDRRSRASGG